MNKKIKIGTRSSKLAVFQAKQVEKKLQELGVESETVFIEPVGDTDKVQPLYEIGITGIFTKRLDIAVLSQEIDIAVHCLKDVPSKLPKGIVQAAVLKREDPYDVLIAKEDMQFFEHQTATIASGSIRRRAQWLHRYPNHRFEELRGNVDTRLKKLEQNDWDGTILAAVGLKRLGIKHKENRRLKLDWMIPAPGQGALVVVALSTNKEILKILENINDEQTALCTQIERDFLRTLEGGCSAPIGALAKVFNDELHFTGTVLNQEGSKRLDYSKTVPLHKAEKLGEQAAHFLIERGARQLMRPRVSQKKEFSIFSTKIIPQDQLGSFNKNIQVEMSNLINIKNNRLKPYLLDKKIENAVFTSQNAVESLLVNFSEKQFNFNNIYCVGKRTKALVEKKIGKVTHTSNSAEKLGTYLLKNLKVKSVTFFCGDKRRDELPDILTENNIQLQEVECYKTVLTKKILDENFDGIMFYSPSGVESYLQTNNPKNQVAFCIGATTANVAKNHFKSIKIAKESTTIGMIELVNGFFKQ